MNLLLNEKVMNYLKELELSENVIILVTDLDKIIFSSKKDCIDINTKISRDLLVTLLQSNVGVTPKYDTDIVNILENTSMTTKFISQIIFPIKIYKECYGAIILLNIKNKIDVTAVEFLSTVKKNIEFYLEEKNLKNIKKYEYNPLYNKKFIYNINELTESYINDLVIDKNYRNIENLLYIKIDTLMTNLEPHSLEILEEIVDLFEQKKELHTLYGAILGSNFNNK